MNFNTLTEMITYIKQHTKMAVIPTKNVARAEKSIMWIFEDAGRDVLNVNGFFTRKQIREAVKSIFAEGHDLEATLSLVLNKIDNM